MKLNIDSKDNIWQIGSGDNSRDYSNVFIEFGVALVGPGHPGDHRNKETKEFYIRNKKVKNWGEVLSRVKKGDWIILRRGQKKIEAVGKVMSDYDYNQIFGDIDGWDLQHFVKVQWYRPTSHISFEKAVLVRSTLASCKKNIVIDRIKSEDFEVHLPAADFTELELPKSIKIENISQSLIDEGIRIQDAENIASTINRIIKLTEWYREHDPKVLEHEIRTFLIVPLLMSLGWSEQKIKIEYNNIDIAVFKQSFKEKNHGSPHIIIEAKRFDDGLSFTDKQPLQYSKDYPSCTILITTNGFRYKIYEKKEEGEFIHSAYLSLLNLRGHHYLDKDIDGAVIALLKMSNFSW